MTLTPEPSLVEIKAQLQTGTVVIIGGGPSLTREDVQRAEQAEVDIIGINNAYEIAGKLTIHYGCDTKWWQAHINKAPVGPMRFSLKRSDKDKGVPGVTQMQRGKREGLSCKWPILSTGGNSGHQAINLAYLLGYTRIVLLGFDQKVTNGKTHWHGDHKFQGAANPVSGTFTKWRGDFSSLAKTIGRKGGVQVINSTRDTALTCFPQMSLEDALCQP